MPCKPLTREDIDRVVIEQAERQQNPRPVRPFVVMHPNDYRNPGVRQALRQIFGPDAFGPYVPEKRSL